MSNNKNVEVGEAQGNSFCSCFINNSAFGFCKCKKIVPLVF